jgi:hypothetical protein
VEWEELKRLKSPAYLSKDQEAFLENFKKAMHQKGFKVSRVQFARRNSWEKRVEQILDVIKRKLK